MYFIKFHFSTRVMKRQSSILSCFSQLSAKQREIGIDNELVSISPTNCAKEQESSVAGCNEDPGATNNTLSRELVEVSLPLHSGASSLQHLDLHVLSDSDRTANPCRTRWVYRHTALEHFNDLYEVVVDVLDEHSKEVWNKDTIADASSLIAAITEFDFVMGFIVLWKSLTLIKPLSMHQSPVQLH